MRENDHRHKPLIRLSALPVDLLSFPLMLILLAVMPIGYAIATLCLLVGVVLARLQVEGALRFRLPGLIRLGLLVVLFVIGTSFFASCHECHLIAQLVWLGSFIIGHIAHYGYKRLFGFKVIAETDTCCCSARRRQALITEYTRFDKILLWFTTVLLAIALSLHHFARTYDQLDLVLSTMIALAALGVIILELLHLSWVRRRLEREHWIQVLDDDHQVIGRVPETDARASHGRLPMVRLIAYSDGMLYLEQDKAQGTAGGQQGLVYDTPFKSWIHEGESAEQAAQRLIDQRFCGVHRAKPRPLLRYHDMAGEQGLLIHLLAVEIEAPDLLQIDCLPIEGRWWCIQQLKPQITRSEFSPYLCAELPLMEQTVLLAQRLRERQRI